MPRIAGVDIPADKKIKISLRYIYGVGPTNAMAILKELGIDPERRAKDLTEEELAFYDALETNDSAVKVLGDETLRTIAREVAEHFWPE